MFYEWILLLVLNLRNLCLTFFYKFYGFRLYIQFNEAFWVHLCLWLRHESIFCTGIYPIAPVLFVEQTSLSPLCVSTFVRSPLPGMYGSISELFILFQWFFFFFFWSIFYWGHALLITILYCKSWNRVMFVLFKVLGIFYMNCTINLFSTKEIEILIRIMLTLGIKMGSLIRDILFVIVTIW